MINTHNDITLQYCSNEAKLIVRVNIDPIYSKLCISVLTIVHKTILQIYSSSKHKVSLSTEFDLPFQTSDNEILACKIDTFLLLFHSCPITKALIIWKRNVPFWDTFCYISSSINLLKKADLAITLYYLHVCLALYVLLSSGIFS